MVIIFIFVKSKGLPDKNIAPPITPDYCLNPKLCCFGTKTREEFRGNYLKQGKVTYNHRKVNIYIVCEVRINYDISSYPTLENCLFDAVTLTKNSDINTYKYSVYGIEFDKGFFSVGDNEIDRNVIIFGVALSSSPHIDIKKTDI